MKFRRVISLAVWIGFSAVEIFPHLSAMELEPLREQLGLMKSICKGSPTKLNRRYACNTCPDYTSTGREPEAGPFQYAGSLSGNFTNPKAQEKLVNLTGCYAGSSAVSGGSILLRKEKNKWKRIQYYRAFNSAGCKIYKVAKRQLLLCEEGFVAQGYEENSLSQVLISDQGMRRNHILRLGNNFGVGCSPTKKSPRFHSTALKAIENSGKTLRLKIESGIYYYPRTPSLFCDDSQPPQMVVGSRRSYLVEFASDVGVLHAKSSSLRAVKDIEAYVKPPPER